MTVVRFSSSVVVNAYNENGVKGLEIAGLTDPEIIKSLMMYCVGRDCIPNVIANVGWPLDRYLEAEKLCGCDEEMLGRLVVEYKSLLERVKGPG